MRHCRVTLTALLIAKKIQLTFVDPQNHHCCDFNSKHLFTSLSVVGSFIVRLFPYNVSRSLTVPVWNSHTYVINSEMINVREGYRCLTVCLNLFNLDPFWTRALRSIHSQMDGWVGIEKLVVVENVYQVQASVSTQLSVHNQLPLGSHEKIKRSPGFYLIFKIDKEKDFNCDSIWNFK